MKKPISSLFAILLVCCFSVSAYADAIIFDTASVGGFAGPVVNDPLTTSTIGFEDYVGDATVGGGDLLLNLQWVGGLTDNGDANADTGIVAFTFLDSSNAFAGGFQATIGEGYFIYGFSIPFDFTIPTEGFLQVDMYTDATLTTAAQGAWFHTAIAPAVGTSPGTGGGAPVGENFMFSLQVNSIPEPASFGLLGFAVIGLGFTRRRS